LILGLALQMLGPGLIMPLFFAFNTLSPQRGRHIELESAAVANLPVSLIVAYVIPMSVMSLPAPTLISYDLKQRVIALWQAWPLLASASMCLLYLMECKKDKGQRKTRPTEEALLRHIYAFAFSYSGFCHLLSLSVLIFPFIYPSPHGLLANIDYLRRVFLPEIPPPLIAPVSVEEGILRFLQWDYGLAALATLVWSLGLHVQGFGQGSTTIECIRLLWRVLVMALLVGPCATAISLVNEWEQKRLSRKLAVSKTKTY
jgi:hypothetical protein